MLFEAFGVASALCVAATNVTWGVSARRGGAVATLMLASPVALAVALLALVIGGERLTPGSVGWGVFAGISGCLGSMAAQEALRGGGVGVVVGTSTCVATVVQVVAGWLLQGTPSLRALTGVLTCTAAVVLTSRSQRHPSRRARSSVLLAATAGALFAGFVLLIQRGGTAPLWALVSARLAILAVVALVATIGRSPRSAAEVRLVYPVAALAGLFDVAGNLFLIGALTAVPLAVLAGLSACTPLLAAMMARVLLKERLRVAQVVGLVVALAGVTLGLSSDAGR